MESKSLISLVNDSTTIEMALVESGGEITPEIEQALTVHANSLAEKIDGYQHIIERFEALETHYKDRMEFFKQAAGHCKTAAERLKNNIKYAMQELGVTELRGNDIRFKLAPTQGTLIIESTDQVPLEFKEEVIETVVKKGEVKKALQAGQTVPGAKLITGFSLRAYPNVPEKKSKKSEVVNG